MEESGPNSVPPKKKRGPKPKHPSNKTLGNVSAETLRANVSDVSVHGDPKAWICVCKASSADEGWMKSTKVMEVLRAGCLVQVTTQQRNPDGSWSLAEALTFVPHVGLRAFQ